MVNHPNRSKARFNPFARVDGRYGAPHGRVSDAPGNFVDAPKLFAHHQGGGDGYDRGGAYWGLPSDVWAVWTPGGEAVIYVRAASRDSAIVAARA
jgi:hypothetical protein